MKSPKCFTPLVVLTAAMIQPVLAADDSAAASSTGASSAVSQVDETAPASESARAAELFERAFQDTVDRNPEFQTALGIKKDYGAWNDRSDAREIDDLARRLGFLAELKRTIDFDQLDASSQLSYRLFEYETEQQARGFPFRHNGYVIDQTGGPLTEVPSLLITQHRVDDLGDARAYIERLRGIKALFAQIGERLHDQAERGIIPPRWVFPRAAEVGRNVIAGQPFDDSSSGSPLWADFQEKVGELKELDEATRGELLREAQAALVEVVRPAYRALLEQWDQLEARAPHEDGVWRFADGAAYYDYLLAAWTTTPLTAEQIHATGLAEVERIQGEMRERMRDVGFTGDLQAFFAHLREDGRFYLPATPEGRQEYLDRAKAVVDDMRGRLDQLFITKPRADIVVKATEEYREKNAPKAFYQVPAPNGSRPGMYYVTLYDMREMPTYQLEAIAYHEGIPGHHMQLAIAQELKGIPAFRRFGGYGAYSEGWGLYCELLPKEIGLYRDPYSDVGRLSTELWRAVRLVVDTGIHAKRWSREQAIDYFVANAPLSRDEVIREVERYIMWPGQATSYKVGMLKILELRERARRELGEAFDIREFHDVLLREGGLPLDLLEEQVVAWIRSKQSGAPGADAPRS